MVRELVYESGNVHELIGEHSGILEVEDVVLVVGHLGLTFLLRVFMRRNAEN